MLLFLSLCEVFEYMQCQNGPKLSWCLANQHEHDHLLERPRVEVKLTAALEDLYIWNLQSFMMPLVDNLRAF